MSEISPDDVMSLSRGGEMDFARRQNFVQPMLGASAGGHSTCSQEEQVEWKDHPVIGLATIYMNFDVIVDGLAIA